MARSLRGLFLVAAGLAILTARAATAQSLPVTHSLPVTQGLPENPAEVVVDELLVQAKEPGPAWWVVQKGDAKVFILGMPPERLARGVNWDQRYLTKRMAGANSLILADTVRVKVGVSSIGGAVKLYKSVRSDQPLEARLQEPLRSRFVAARQKLGQPASRYAKWSVFMASMMLVSDAERPGSFDPRDDVLRAAKSARVRRVSTPAVDASGLISDVFSNLSPGLETACMTAAVSTVEKGRPARIAEGWARGDVAAAMSGPRDYEGCLLLLNGGSQIWRRAVTDSVNAIDTALAKPGHSLATVDLSMLVAEEGVLRRLQAKGLQVTGPGLD